MQVTFDLKEQTAFITGATSGFGARFAEVLSDAPALLANVSLLKPFLGATHGLESSPETSIASWKPSLSVSAVELGSTTVNRLAGVKIGLLEPPKLVATMVNVPAADPESIVIAADVPSGAITVVAMVGPGGVKAKVAPVKLAPLTAMGSAEAPVSVDFGVTEVMIGLGAI